MRSFLRRVSANRLTIFLAVLCIGLLCTAMLHLWLYHTQTRIVQERLTQQAALAAVRLESRMERLNEMVRGIRGAFLVDPDLDGKDFVRLLRQQRLTPELGDYLMAAYIREVPVDEVAEFLAKRHNPELGDAGQVTLHAPVARESYYLIDYLYPDNEITRAYQGFDIGQVVARRQALESIRDRNQPVLSPPITLLALKMQPLAFALRYPVYHPEMPLDSVGQRREAFNGFLSITVPLSSVTRWVEQALPANVHYSLWQTWQDPAWGAATKPTRMLEGGQKALQGGLHSEALVNQQGGQWRLVLIETPASRANLLWVWPLGLALSLLAALAATVDRPRQASRGGAIPVSRGVERIVTLVEHLPAMVVLRDAANVVIYGNRAAQAWLGGDVPLLGREDAIWSSAELDPGPGQEALHLVLPDRHGEERHLALKTLPLSGYPGHRVVIVRDVTDEQQREVELTLRRQRMSELLEIVCDWYWELDTEHRITYVSSSQFARAGINLSALLGKRSWEIDDGGLSQQEWDAHRERLDRRQPYRDFILRVPLEGRHYIVSLSGRPHYDSAGRFQGYRGVARDVSESFTWRERVQVESVRCKRMLEALGEGLIGIDASGRVQYMNPAAAALTGFSSEDAAGMPIERVLVMVDTARGVPLPNLCGPLLLGQAQTVRPRRCVLLNRYSLRIMVEESAAAMRDDGGNLAGVVITFRDEGVPEKLPEFEATV
ncbi:CHASE domain-containing protein [Chitiniphilus eburneus]|uniref:PAS domain S-box protein n=1 Tax=Chitiniphilus eburneus TaxID=2571148 RepID=A0A4U0Q9K0_9NEIS|nr:CHASE domain-containing protein [Chitiniphilus eburneus]TJZ77630.1 PAS domain S-box protein [Chitiniphilus eburneus]